ncbi:MAG: di-heme oxidoredictase family protein [Hyphomicrobiaceae bacterium]
MKNLTGKHGTMVLAIAGMLAVACCATSIAGDTAPVLDRMGMDVEGAAVDRGRFMQRRDVDAGVGRRAAVYGPQRGGRLHVNLPDAVDGLDDDSAFRFTLGGLVFNKTWVSAPSSTTSSNGLGPLFNARSCGQCHPGGGQGRPDDPARPGQAGPALVLRLSVPARSGNAREVPAKGSLLAVGEPHYGRQLQPQAIQGFDGEGRLQRRLEPFDVKLGDGSAVALLRPGYHVTQLAYGRLAQDIMTSARLAPDAPRARAVGGHRRG